MGKYRILIEVEATSTGAHPLEEEPLADAVLTDIHIPDQLHIMVGQHAALRLVKMQLLNHPARTIAVEYQGVHDPQGAVLGEEAMLQLHMEPIDVPVPKPMLGVLAKMDQLNLASYAMARLRRTTGMVDGTPFRLARVAIDDAAQATGVCPEHKGQISEQEEEPEADASREAGTPVQKGEGTQLYRKGQHTEEEDAVPVVWTAGDGWPGAPAPGAPRRRKADHQAGTAVQHSDEGSEAAEEER
jgi:hypothetical protein